MYVTLVISPCVYNYVRNDNLHTFKKHKCIKCVLMSELGAIYMFYRLLRMMDWALASMRSERYRVPQVGISLYMLLLLY